MLKIEDIILPFLLANLLKLSHWSGKNAVLEINTKIYLFLLLIGKTKTFMS